MTFTDRQFRDALGLFPTGVAVVTARSPAGYNVGVTVNSFTSVSLRPPLVSFNLAKSLRSIGDLTRAGNFAVNLLHERQRHVSASFARAETDKWNCVDCVEGSTGSPLLAGHLAAFECETYATHEAGDHVIVIGRVLRIAVDGEAAPLLFYRGAYRAIGPAIDEAERRSAPRAAADVARRTRSEKVEG